MKRMKVHCISLSAFMLVNRAAHQLQKTVLFFVLPQLLLELRCDPSEHMQYLPHGIQLRQTAQDPQGPDTLPIPLQTMDSNTRQI